MKPEVIFVGAFNTAERPGIYGGQLTACRSLLRGGLGDTFSLHLVDSARANNAASGVRRAWSAARRLCRVAWLLASRPVRALLVFAPAGAGFIEKGVMVLLGRVAGVRVVLFPRSGRILEQSARSRVFAAYVRHVVRTADRVVCQGREWTVFYHGLAPEAPAGTFVEMLNWIDMAALDAARWASRGAARVTYVGHLYPFKGALDLVEAVEPLWEAYPNLELHVYGEGPLQDELERRSALAPPARFVLHGAVDPAGVVQALHDADVFVLPSHTEGFPNVLLEAMAAGLPSVACDVGAVRTVVRDGVNGLLVPARDPMKLRAALVRLLGDKRLRDQIAAAALEEVELRHSNVAAARVVGDIIDGRL